DADRRSGKCHGLAILAMVSPGYLNLVKADHIDEPLEVHRVFPRDFLSTLQIQHQRSRPCSTIFKRDDPEGRGSETYRPASGPSWGRRRRIRQSGEPPPDR